MAWLLVIVLDDVAAATLDEERVVGDRWGGASLERKGCFSRPWSD
jgi:hypothetical protein